MITVVGIGADGWPSLSPEARAAVLAADLLVGGDRQLALLPIDERAPQRRWPQQLTTLVDELPALAAGRSIVVVASGDPLVHGVGVTILRRLGDEDVRLLPAVSSLLSRAQAEQGGRLTRLAIAQAEQFGGLTGWRPDRPVTQWVLRA